MSPRGSIHPAAGRHNAAPAAAATSRRVRRRGTASPAATTGRAIVHSGHSWSISSWAKAGDGTNKKPRPNGGVWDRLGLIEFSAHAIASPREGTFFHLRCDTRKRDHVSIMRCDPPDVNGVTLHSVHSRTAEKKPGPREPGLGIGLVRPTQSPSKRDY